MRLVCFIAFNLLTTLSFAQSVKGRVADDTGTPISFSTITLLNPIDSTIVAFDTSNDNGFYEIKHDKLGKYLLSVRFLGFETEYKAVELDQTPAIVDFSLKENSIYLGEIMIRGQKTGLQYQNDTIRYDVKHFSDGTEEVLGDLLKKMPGIEVDDKGGVRAQGKSVEKVLVNGQEFFGGNSQVAVKNLSADYAESVEILNNYSEYSLLRGFETHNKTVMNVGVKESKLGKLSGNISAGGGVKNKFDAGGDVMLIKPRAMFTLLESANNVGSEVFSIEDYIRLQGGISETFGDVSSGSASFELSKEEEDLLLPRNDVSKRINGFTGFNTALQPNEKFKMNSHFLFNHNDEDFSSQNTYHYNVASQSPYSMNELRNGDNRKRLFSAQVKMDYSISPSTILSYYGKAFHTNYDTHSDLYQSISNSSLNATERGKTKSTSTDHQLRIIKRRDKHLFSFSYFYSYVSKPSSLRIDTDSLLLPLSYQLLDDTYNLYQKKTYYQTSTGITLSYVYKCSEHLNFNAGFRVDYTSQEFNNDIDDNPPMKDDNKLSNKYVGYQPYLSLNKNQGFFRFKVGVNYSALKHTTFPLKGYKKIDHSINPNVSFALHFSKRHSLDLIFKMKDEPLNVNSYYNNMYLSNFQTYLLGSSINKALSKQYSTSLSYRFFDLFTNTMLIVVGGFNYNKDALTKNYIQEGIVSKYSHIASKPTESSYLKLHLNKGLGFIPWTFKIVSGINYNRNYNEYQNVANRINLLNFNNEITLVSNSQESLFNYELRYKVEHYKTDASLINKSLQNIQYVSGKLKISPTAKLLADIECEYSLNRTSQFGKKKNVYLNSSITYKFTNKFQVQILAKNFLNINNQKWFANSYNENYILEQSYQQIPGYVMGKLKYSF